YAMSRTRDAIASLVKLRPSEAVLLTSEGEARVPVEQLKKGDRVRVIAFDSIPVDGEILEGSTSVNQAVMTGESRPVARTVGEPL
ncbi:heavy metal translocating P-type ATPase, partial [Escherichia coli]